MTPADKTEQARTESLSFEFDLPHSPQKVWRAITDPALLSEWLLPVVEGAHAHGVGHAPVSAALGLQGGQQAGIRRPALRLEHDGRQARRSAREDAMSKW